MCAHQTHKKIKKMTLSAVNNIKNKILIILSNSIATTAHEKHPVSSPSTINEAYTQANKDWRSLEEKKT